MSLKSFFGNALKVIQFGVGVADKVEQVKGSGNGAAKHEAWQMVAELGLPIILDSIGHDGSNSAEIVQLTGEIKDRVIRLQKLLAEKA